MRAYCDFTLETCLTPSTTKNYMCLTGFKTRAKRLDSKKLLLLKAGVYFRTATDKVLI